MYPSILNIYIILCREIPLMNQIVELFRIEQEIKRAKSQGVISTTLVDLYDHAILIKNQISNRLGLAKTYAEKAQVLEQMGLHQDALKTISKAAEIAKNSPNHQFRAILNNQIQGLQ